MTDLNCPTCKQPLNRLQDTDDYYCRKCEEWFFDRMVPKKQPGMISQLRKALSSK